MDDLELARLTALVARLVLPALQRPDVDSAISIAVRMVDRSLAGEDAAALHPDPKTADFMARYGPLIDASSPVLRDQRVADRRAKIGVVK